MQFLKSECDPCEDLQQLMTRFSDACRDFGLTISLKKTQVMGQDTDCPPAISINDHELDVIHDFVYLGSAISDTLSLDAELDRRVDKAATTMTRLTKKAWNNSKLTVHTKIQIYRACVVSTLLYSGESWTVRARQAQCFSHAQPPTHSEHHLAGQGPNVLERAGCTSMSCTWTTDGSPKTSMENSCRENVPQADHSCDSKMCARGT